MALSFYCFRLELSIDLLGNVFTYSLLLAALVAFPSGIIQGYAGFGGALVAVPFFAVLFNPVAGFAIILFVVLFGQGLLCYNSSKIANWREIVPVTIAYSITVSIGINFLVSAEPLLTRKFMGIIILILIILMISGWNYSGRRNLMSRFITGGVSGAISGGFGVPGFPIQVMFFQASTDAIEIKRANVLAALGLAVIISIIVLIIQQVYTQEMLLRSVLIAPTFILGTKLGECIFKIAPVYWFKPVTYAILVCTALMLFLV